MSKQRNKSKRETWRDPAWTVADGPERNLITRTELMGMQIGRLTDGGNVRTLSTEAREAQKPERRERQCSSPREWYGAGAMLEDQIDQQCPVRQRAACGHSRESDMVLVMPQVQMENKRIGPRAGWCGRPHFPRVAPDGAPLEVSGGFSCCVG